MTRKYSSTYVLTLILVCFTAGSTFASNYVAYSLRQAERHLAQPKSQDSQVTSLGGITHIAGMVHDESSDDWILVGKAMPGSPGICLDDLVTAIRAICLYNHSPEVSIDATADTVKTRLQVVTFKGGVENSQLGKDMLEMDVLLKLIALGEVQSGIWGIDSYLSHRVKQASQSGERDRIASRFWFENSSPALASREGVCVLTELGIKIRTEVLSTERNGQTLTGSEVRDVTDSAGDSFANEVTVGFEDLCTQHPQLLRARVILAVACIAQFMHEENARVDYWLTSYKINKVETRKVFQLIEKEMDVPSNDLKVTVTGGLRINPSVVRLLARGHFSAFKEVVLKSRPSKDSLIWRPPLKGWYVPGAEDLKEPAAAGQEGLDNAGFSVEAAVLNRGLRAQAAHKPFAGYNPLPRSPRLPSISFSQQATHQSLSPHVGGVMLSGKAKADGASKAEVNLGDGNFSLIVDGQNARLDPKIFRRFVTTLWAVYYGQTIPGISIDPMYQDPETGEFSEKHMVRYIGKVINTDLGRVMREADYQMKKWSVGTERACIPGFKTPDDYSAGSRFRYRSLSRFWLTPENMKWSKTGKSS
jgi:hypothetical protein